MASALNTVSYNLLKVLAYSQTYVKPLILCLSRSIGFLPSTLIVCIIILMLCYVMLALP